MSAPQLSVIMPVLNAATYVPSQLAQLDRQETGISWELVLADNGSTDGTIDILHRFAETRSHVRVVDASQSPGVSHARNVGIAASSAPLIAICDADDLVDTGWVSAMYSGLFRYDLCAGSIAFSLRPSLVDFQTAVFTKSPQVHNGFLPIAVGCNLGTTRRLLRLIGGFDSDSDGADDVDYSWRAQLSGARFGFLPEARVVKSGRVTGRAAFRQHRASGEADVWLQKRFSQVGYAGVYARALRLSLWMVPRLPIMALPKYRLPLMKRCGRIFGVGRATLTTGRTQSVSPFKPPADGPGFATPVSMGGEA